MLWPRLRRPVEAREGIPFTNAVVLALEAQATGAETGNASTIAALEAASALYANAFSAARIDPPEARAVLTPNTMALVARNLIRRGEDVHQVMVEGGRMRLQPIGSWDVRGGPREADWWYRADRFGPSGNLTELVPAGSVLHCRYAVDSARPWHGLAPLAWARATGTLAANLETRLGEEAGSSVGFLLPVPHDGRRGDGPDDGSQDDGLDDLRRDIRTLRGRTGVLETTAAGWGMGMSSAPRSDYKPMRLGADPPASLPSLRSEAGLSVLSACGVPVALVTDKDGTAAREGWRRFVMGSVEPLLDRVRVEVEAKLEMAVSFDLTGLWAHDLQGRASAFQRLVAGGVSVNEALATSGLLTETE